MSNKVFIQSEPKNFDQFLEYANKHYYNLEIASFAYSHILDGNWELLLEEYKKKLEDFSGIISNHGAFIDLVLHSSDSEIRKISEKKAHLNLKIATELNAKYIVFHTNFNPLINHDSYRNNWLNTQAVFWNEVIQKYDITVVLENLWERDPIVLRKLIDKVDSKFLKVCLDTGHINIYSKAPMEEWFSMLNDDIIYIHVNDNKGKIDNELVPGQGTINWQDFSESIRRYNLEPNIIYEVGSLEKTIKAIVFFKQNDIYPF